jgi:hypothetical protein
MQARMFEHFKQLCCTLWYIQSLSNCRIKLPWKKKGISAWTKDTCSCSNVAAISPIWKGPLRHHRWNFALYRGAGIHKLCTCLGVKIVHQVFGCHPSVVSQKILLKLFCGSNFQNTFTCKVQKHCNFLLCNKYNAKKLLCATCVCVHLHYTPIHHAFPQTILDW